MKESLTALEVLAYKDFSFKLKEKNREVDTLKRVIKITKELIENSQNPDFIKQKKTELQNLVQKNKVGKFTKKGADMTPISILNSLITKLEDEKSTKKEEKELKRMEKKLEKLEPIVKKLKEHYDKLEKYFKNNNKDADVIKATELPLEDYEKILMSPIVERSGKYNESFDRLIFNCKHDGSEGSGENLKKKFRFHDTFNDKSKGNEKFLENLKKNLISKNDQNIPDKQYLAVDKVFDCSGVTNQNNEEIYNQVLQTSVSFNREDIFVGAYGQSGSGKSYLMLGDEDLTKKNRELGLIVHILNNLKIDDSVSDIKILPLQIFRGSVYNAFVGPNWDRNRNDDTNYENIINFFRGENGVDNVPIKNNPQESYIYHEKFFRLYEFNYQDMINVSVPKTQKEHDSKFFLNLQARHNDTNLSSLRTKISPFGISREEKIKQILNMQKNGVLKLVDNSFKHLNEEGKKDYIDRLYEYYRDQELNNTILSQDNLGLFYPPARHIIDTIFENSYDNINDFNYKKGDRDYYKKNRYCLKLSEDITDEDIIEILGKTRIKRPTETPTTGLNDYSSRSHLFVIFEVTYNDGVKRKITIADLAGLEPIMNSAKSNPNQVRERATLTHDLTIFRRMFSYKDIQTQKKMKNINEKNKDFFENSSKFINGPNPLLTTKSKDQSKKYYGNIKIDDRAKYEEAINKMYYYRKNNYFNIDDNRDGQGVLVHKSQHSKTKSSAMFNMTRALSGAISDNYCKHFIFGHFHKYSDKNTFDIKCKNTETILKFLAFFKTDFYYDTD